MKSFAVLATLLASTNAMKYWCGNSCSRDASTMDDCSQAIASVNTDGTNNGQDRSVWKYGGCRIDFIPKLASAGESKSVKNSVAQTYAQKVLDNCGDASDGGSAIGGIAIDSVPGGDLEGGCVCVHSTQSETVCDCGGSNKFGDCIQGHEIGS